MSSSRGRVRLKAIAKLGGRCANPCCRWQNEDGSFGCTDPDMLQIDHPLGGGNIDRKVRNLHTLYRDVLNAPSGTYQLLCANCNWKKRKIQNEIVGRPHTEETKLRISKALTGRVRSVEHRANISAANHGRQSRPCKPEAKLKISARHKGRIITPEWRAKISATKQRIKAERISRVQLSLL
jgi:hypothetical protein